MFFVIDGIDASGKKTQVDLVSTKLQEYGKTVKIIDFPRYDEQASYFVRKYLKWEYGKHVSAEMSSLFFAMDRYDASQELRSDIETYDYVIANRYVSSSMIHHGCKIDDMWQRQDFFDWLEQLEYQICGIPVPDTIIFLSMSLENNIKLIHSRLYASGTTELDLHESDNQYLKKAWDTAQQVSRQYNWERIDCELDGEILPREEITQMILSIIL